MYTVHFNLVVVVADKDKQYTDSKVLRLTRVSRAINMQNAA